MILYELIALYKAFPAVPNISWYFDAQPKTLSKILIIVTACIAKGIVMRSHLDDNGVLAWLQAWYCHQFRLQYIPEGYWNITFINSRWQCPACMAAVTVQWSWLGLGLEVRVRVRYLKDCHKISFPKWPWQYLSNHVSQSIISTRIVTNPGLIWRSVVITFTIYPVFDTHIQV